MDKAKEYIIRYSESTHDDYGNYTGDYVADYVAFRALDIKELQDLQYIKKLLEQNLIEDFINDRINKLENLLKNIK